MADHPDGGGHIGRTLPVRHDGGSALVQDAIERVAKREGSLLAMYTSFREFYPFYLGEHADRRCRRMHFLGSWLVIAAIAVAAATGNRWWLIAAPACGYGCAWIGHFAFERNKPATFRHPLYSLLGDWAMFADILRGQVRL